VAVAQSKLATLLFAIELDRRARANAWGLLSVAAHPGYSRTNLQSTGPRDGKARQRRGWDLTGLLGQIPGMSQTAAEGALPALLAATGPDVQSGDYYGPGRNFGLVGPPVLLKLPARGQNEQIAAALWSISSELTLVTWPAAASPRVAAA